VAKVDFLARFIPFVERKIDNPTKRDSIWVFKLKVVGEFTAELAEYFVDGSSGVGTEEDCVTILGIELRLDRFQLKDPSTIALCWIVDFPFYEWDESRQKVDFGHNPFSMPKGGLSALENAETDEDKLAIVADQYDMVMNGYEICSGGVRNHNPDVLYKVFGLLGYDKTYVEEKFGAMLSAFKYGAPPHAGCAFGVDRMFMELMGESNIREVIAFPKNGSGVDVMMNSPSTIDAEQLKELGL
jgi:aspartyl-tRNA synthetase